MSADTFMSCASDATSTYDPQLSGKGPISFDVQPDDQPTGKQMKHLAQMIKRNKSRHEDNKSCATTIVLWGVLNAVAWMVPVLGEAWWTKVWSGAGVDKVAMNLGLLTMNVEVRCTPSGPAGLCQALMQHSGEHSLVEMQKTMCDIDRSACSMMQQMVYSGYVQYYALPTTAFLEVAAVIFMCIYWNAKPTSQLRALALQVAAFGPFVAMAGFTSWMIMCPSLNEIPRIWAKEGGNQGIAGNPLLDLKESQTFQFGWCCLMFFFVMGSSLIRFLVQFSLPYHIDDPNSEMTRLLAEVEGKGTESV